MGAVYGAAHWRQAGEVGGDRVFGRLGTWWDHRPLWQKIGLGVAGAVGAAAGGAAMLGGGAAGAGAAGATAAGEAGGASALGAGTALADTTAAGIGATGAGGAGLGGYIGGAINGAAAGGASSGFSDTAAAAALKSMASPHGFRAMLAAHPGMLKYGKLAAGSGYNMYQDVANKKAAEEERRRALAATLMSVQGPGQFPMWNGSQWGGQ